MQTNAGDRSLRSSAERWLGRYCTATWTGWSGNSGRWCDVVVILKPWTAEHCVFFNIFPNMSNSQSNCVRMLFDLDVIIQNVSKCAIQDCRYVACFQCWTFHYLLSAPVNALLKWCVVSILKIWPRHRQIWPFFWRVIVDLVKIRCENN